MYSVLVAEDDDIIRKGLIKIISKMDLPFDNFYEASNGNEAVNLTKSFSPHIIITDIKMSGMDGLDFIECIRAAGLNNKCIIISGYSEFSFAQRAINYNVTEYLLKPIRKDKLYEALQKTITELIKEDENTKYIISTDNRIKKLQFMVLKDILEGQYNGHTIKSLISESNIKFAKEGFIVLSAYSASSLDSLSDYFINRIGIAKLRCYYTTKYNHLISLININKNEFNEILNLLSSVIEHIKKEQRTDTYIGISEWTNEITDFPKLAAQAKNSLDFRLIDTNQQIFIYNESRMCKAVEYPFEIYYEEILNSVNSSNTQEISISVDHLFDSIIQNTSLTASALKNIIQNLMLYYIFPRRRDFANSNFDIENLYQSCRSLLDLKIQVKKLLFDLIKKQDVNVDKLNNRIKAAVSYIEKNYNKKLSLEDVANYVNINTYYFSSIFKKDTGMCFTDFLQKVRIEQSKKLLMQPQYKIYEIAEKVGFTDEKYYCKVFKKYTGITASQYKNKLGITE